MKNRSFWNKTAGAKAKMFAGAALAALTALLVLVVCSNDPDDGGEKNNNQSDPCANGPTVECCATQPNFTGCGTTDQCVTNPTYGCAGYCDTHQSDPQCQTTNPCSGGATPACCAAQPSFSGCTSGGGDGDHPLTGTYCYWAADGTNPVSCEPIGGPYCEGSTCTEDLCRGDYGQVIADCANPPTTTYCDYGFGNCIPSTQANCNQYGAFTTSCPASTGKYCAFSGPDKYGEGGCYFRPNSAVCDQWSEEVTQAVCESQNTANPCIADAKKPGDPKVPGCNSACVAGSTDHPDPCP